MDENEKDASEHEQIMDIFKDWYFKIHQEI